MRYEGRIAAGILCQLVALCLGACSGGGASFAPNPPPPDTPDTTAPSVPTGLAATALSGTSIQVTWSASTDAGAGVAGYRVYRDGGTDPIATVTVTTYTDTGLSPGTAYSYTVRAFDAATPANVSAASGAVDGTTTTNPPPADTTPPTVPSGVTATAQSSSSIQVSWTASTDAGTGVAGYRVFRDNGANPVATVTATTYTDTGLSAATSYSYTVRAFDGATPANVSGASAAANATTNNPPTSGSGLDSRPSNTTCLAGDPPSTTLTLGLQRVYPNLTFDLPVLLLQEPGTTPSRLNTWYVVQKLGLVRKFDRTNNNVATATTFVNLASKLSVSGTDERGLLGMAFHPNFPTDPRVYFYYTAPGGSTGLIDRVSEFRSTDGGATVDPATELVLFNVEDPEDNHNGGNIAFGPDGYLYIGIGDGGGGGDDHPPIGNGQRLTTLLGKMLRIDIANSSSTTTYAIPGTNPFAGGARCNATGSRSSGNCPEIYAYGLRNPWRWSFDRGSGELWLNDVGQDSIEEVDKITLGGNYGWRCLEGTSNYNPSACGPNPSPIAPIAQYNHSQGNSTTGGFVYRGSGIPSLSGRYVFGDFSTGFIWHIARDTTPTLTLTTATGFDSGHSISTFGQDSDGEIYIFDLYDGTIFKLVPGAGGGRQIPTQLSQTGCVNSGNAAQPAAGLIPYQPSAPFYSDGAVKRRWLALPDGQRMVIGADDDLTFPSGSVLMKDFTLGGKLIETRLFMRHNDGNWAGYTYEWNAAGTDATRVVGGKSVTINGQTWDYPSEAQCLQCHTAGAGRSLGLEIGTLNSNFGYPTGRTANQLTTLNAIDTLTPALTTPVDQLAVIPDPQGTAPVAERARAWLHANCSYCHRPGGGTPTDIDFRYTTTLANTNTCNIVPTAGDLGIANARRIAPGSAASSVVVERVRLVGTNAMPPLARHTVDTAGLALLTNWINGLANCN